MEIKKILSQTATIISSARSHTDEQLVVSELNLIQENLDKIKEYIEEKLQQRIDKALELLDSYKLGKYDYALTPAGLLDFEDILRGKDNE